MPVQIVEEVSSVESNWSRTERKLGLGEGELRAVLYVHNRSWTTVTLFGYPTVWRQKDTHAISGGSILVHHPPEELPEVPGSSHLHDATDYGYVSGKVLYVGNAPPETCRGE